MRKLLKIIGIALGVLVVLLVAAVLLVPLWFDPNDYKDQIVAVLEKQAGRDVEIEGDLGVSVFPWLGVEVGRVRVANAQGFGNEPLAHVESADIRVKLMPLLLRRQVEMDTVRLDGLVLNLARNKAGRTNWEGMLGEAEPAAAPSESDTSGARETGADGPAVGVLALGGIQVRNASVTWDDQGAGTHYTLRQVSLNSGEIVPGQPFDISTEFDFEAREPALNGHATLSGEVSMAPDAGQYQLRDGAAAVLVKGEGLPPAGVEGRLATELAADLKQQTLTVPKLALTAAGVNVRGNLQGKSILDAPALQGALQVEEFNPREVLKRLGQPDPVMADPQALTRMQAALEVRGSLQQLIFDKITAQLDSSTLTGNAEVRDLDNPKVAFDLALDGIDVDRYLAPPTAQEQPVVPPTGAAAAAAGALPVELLRTLNLNGTLRVGKLKVSGLQASNIQLKLAAKDGVVRMQPATAELYQGKYEGNMNLDVRGAVPRLTMNDKLTGVQAGPLLKDLTGNDRITGTANVSAQLGMDGLTPEAIRSSLNGNARLAFQDGAVKGINIAGSIREVRARLRGEKPPQENEANQTDFSELTGTLNIVNGVVHNKDLSGKSPLLRVSGEGTADLKTEAINYLLKAVFVKTLKGQGGAGLEELQGVTIPVRVAGTFADPSIRPDLEAALGGKVRGEVQERVEQEREKLKKRLDEKLQERLKGLIR